ncbi:MAG: FAD-binding oxidoreductase [Betaproteobacteria bacterium]|nr:FAD-binding oxidoreductase [Betaproteobacteria bacterium]
MTESSPLQDYETRKAALARAMRTAGAAPVRLAKSTSNLFRDRAAAPRSRLDVRQFSHVLGVDRGAGWVDAEGMTPYVDLVEATLAQGLMPAVVPQLKWITLGGAVAGVGIEASSFKSGLVHETVAGIEVLLGDGSVVLATPENEHRDLFFGFPNSYGTLGYALRLRARTLPVLPFVRLEHRHYERPDAFFADLAVACAGNADFIDGVVFGAKSMAVTIGRFIVEAPYTSDYGFERIYYRSIRERDEDFLTVRDFLWRWDTDWFWCSKNLGAQHPLIRRLLGRERLNSRFYAGVMRWNARWGVTRMRDRLLGRHPEPVIQDVDIPIGRAAEFLDFFHREIGILPVWICPIRAAPAAPRFPLYPTPAGTLLVNFGFWDVVRSRTRHAAGHFNRLIERKVSELGGIKSLYSDSYFGREEFWSIYDRSAYAALKARYDPRSALPDLYDKCVLKA